MTADMAIAGEQRIFPQKSLQPSRTLCIVDEPFIADRNMTDFACAQTLTPMQSASADDAAADAVLDQHDEAVLPRLFPAPDPICLSDGNGVRVILQEDWEVNAESGREELRQVYAVPPQNRSMVGDSVVSKKTWHRNIQAVQARAGGEFRYDFSNQVGDGFRRFLR